MDPLYSFLREIFVNYIVNTLLIAVLQLVFFIGLYNLLSWGIRRKIKRAKASADATRLRKRIVWVRWIVTIIFIVFILASTHFLYSLPSERKLSTSFPYFSWIRTSILAIILTLTAGKMGAFKLPLSTKTINDVYGSYILYLRAFEKDSYHNSKYAFLLRKTFVEKHLAKRLKKKARLYSVGMTKEIESPHGADRIYVDDTNWKDDVLELMKSSMTIVVLISERDSCIWEIEQSASMLEKTFFIVDNYKTYNLVKEKMDRKINLPEIKPSNNHSITFFYYRRGKAIIDEFDCRFDQEFGYDLMANLILQFSTTYPRTNWHFHSSAEIIERYQSRSYPIIRNKKSIIFAK